MLEEVKKELQVKQLEQWRVQNYYPKRCDTETLVLTGKAVVHYEPLMLIQLLDGGYANPTM